MKVTWLLMLALLVQAQAESFAQQVTLKRDRASLKDIFSEIRIQTGYIVLYRTTLLKGTHPVTIDLRREPLRQSMTKILAGQHLDFTIEGKEIIITEERTAPENVRDPIPGEEKQSRQIAVNGTVTDTAGFPLPGVSVQVKGTTIGTSTDLEGNFTLPDIDEQAILSFSYMGFLTLEIPVAGRSDFTIILRKDAQTLEEVVVVGYGAQVKRNIISGISSLSTEQSGLEDQVSPTAGALLKGRISGVNIRDNTGAAGAAPSIQIRGISSINAGVGPLIVIDGFPVGTSFPQTLNPDEIAEISVLKDAAATAIYGARGSNGVVLIRTKSAREGVSEFTYNAYVATNEVPHSWRPQMMNALEYAQYNIERIEALDVFNNASTPTPVPDVFTNVVNNPEAWRDGGTNWLDEFLREGSESITHNHSLTYRNGSERLKTVVLGGYMNQEGIIPGNDFQRLSLRTKFDAILSPKIKMGINLSGARTTENKVETDGSRSALWAAIVGSPLQSPYDDKGNPTFHMPGDATGYFAMPNPLHSLNAIDNKVVNKDLQVNVDLDFEIVKGLNYRPRVYGRQLTRSLDYFKPTTVGNFATAGARNLYAGGPPQPNSKTYESFELENWGVDNLLNYTLDIHDHNVNILVGHTIQKEAAITNTLNGAVFPSDDIINFGEAGEVLGSNNYYDWSTVAGFGRINYNYLGKYLFEFSFRREGSSRLGSNRQFGNFPSGAVGWRISDERFYPEDFFINDFMINASLGKTGNNSIGNYDALGRLNPIRTVMGGMIAEGKFQSSISNDDLKWETALQYQIGAQLSMLQSRINLRASYFKKTTKDMLFNVVLPGASGYNSARINLGEMENKGLELEINSANILKNDFQWNTDLNISFLSNEVTRMPEQIERIIAGPIRGTNITRSGEEVGAFFGFLRLGLFDEHTIVDPNLYGWQGDRKILGTNIFKDINNDGVINYDDRTVIGSPHPDVIYGINNRLSYKNISLSILVTGMLGYEIMKASRGVFYNNAARWNVSKELLHRWKSPDEPGNGQVPRTAYNLGNRESMNDWLEPGDHLWIKNVNVSYTFSDISEKIGSLRLYLTVNNLARFDNYSGFNPEVSLSGGNPLSIGVDEFVYPISRSYSIGVDFKF